MSETDSSFDFSEPNETLLTAQEKVKRSIGDITTLDLAQQPGRLVISEVPSSIRMSRSFSEVVAKYDWPNLQADSEVNPPEYFLSNQDLLNALGPYDADSMGDDLDIQPGPKHIASSYLFRLLNVPLVDEIRQATTSGDAGYGLIAAKHRADIIAPDLFRSLEIILPIIATRYPGVTLQSEDGTLYDSDSLREYLMNEGMYVADAIKIAHQILGRLVKTDDLARFYDALGSPSVASNIVNADDIILREPK